MDERMQVLLTEYETCQSHNNALGTQSWTSYGIVFSVNAVLLAAIAYQVISKGKDLELFTPFLVLGLALLMFLFLRYFLKIWIERVTFLTYVNHERMRKIEDEILLNDSIIMEKTWLIRGLDLKYEYDHNISNDWCQLSEERKNLINSICTRYPTFPTYKRPSAPYFIRRMFYIVIIPWTLLTIISFVLSLLKLVNTA